MSKSLSLFFKSSLSFFSFLYFLVFALGLFFYVYSISNLLGENSAFTFQQYFWWTVMGLSLSLLSCLCAWPLSLAIATLLEQFKKKKMVMATLRFLYFIESLPLIVFVFLYYEVVGFHSFGWFDKFWNQYFTATHFLTKGIAFALTILLYPLTIFPIFGEDLNVDQLYQKLIFVVSDFAEVGLVTSVIVFGLMVYILPKMVLQMSRSLSSTANLRNHEIIQSIGGTHWESVYMTVVQSMKEHFNFIILRFTRICFFEAIITYTLLNSFFSTADSAKFHWGSTLSSMFVVQAIDPEISIPYLNASAGVLILCFLIFIWMERLFLEKLRVSNA